MMNNGYFLNFSEMTISQKVWFIVSKCIFFTGQRPIRPGKKDELFKLLTDLMGDK